MTTKLVLTDTDRYIVQYGSQMPQVYRIYRIEDEGCIAYVLVIERWLYHRESYTEIYDHLNKYFPDTSMTFHCIPVMLLIDTFFLPEDMIRIYQRD